MNNIRYKSPIFLTIIVCILLFSGGVWYRFYRSNTLYENAPISDTDVVMTVGGETIYGRDFLYELSMYPETDDAQRIILDKLRADSIILQGAKEDGLLSLDDSFYNSLNKDYTKRIQVITQVKRQIEERASAIEGYVVGIWFRNNGYIGALGLEKSKSKAYEKVLELRNQVASQKMTILEAGEIIKNDGSLKDLDLAYRNNAIFQFKAYRGQPKGITLSGALDNELWNLNVGEVSEVYIGKAKDPETSEIYEALYSFGQVTSVSAKGKSYQSFEDWLSEKMKVYDL